MKKLINGVVLSSYLMTASVNAESEFYEPVKSTIEINENLVKEILGCKGVKDFISQGKKIGKGKEMILEECKITEKLNQKGLNQLYIIKQEEFTRKKSENKRVVEVIQENTNILGKNLLESMRNRSMDFQKKLSTDSYKSILDLSKNKDFLK